MEIVRAKPGDAATLTTLAHAAKRHWGYPEEWIQQWAGTLTITAPLIRTCPTYAALLSGKIVGFCSARIVADTAVLEHLWVAPGHLKAGIGRALFRYIEKIAGAAGAERIRVESDPHAEGFYQRMGAITVGRNASSIPGRFLPVLEKKFARETRAAVTSPPRRT